MILYRIVYIYHKNKRLLTKAATVETGYTLQVPLFVKEGDVLVINTSEGTYVSRA